jgi:hypothetical protein
MMPGMKMMGRAPGCGSVVVGFGGVGRERTLAVGAEVAVRDTPALPVEVLVP